MLGAESAAQAARAEVTGAIRACDPGSQQSDPRSLCQWCWSLMSILSCTTRRSIKLRRLGCCANPDQAQQFRKNARGDQQCHDVAQNSPP